MNATIMNVTVKEDASIKELAEILINLRHHTVNWQNHFGADRRLAMKKWEARADRWIGENIQPITQSITN